MTFNKGTLFTILGLVGSIAGMIFTGMATTEKNKATVAEFASKEAAKLLKENN